jgi:3-hydroxyisobutyrate dehydrogenase-like beta-hydroxyacid dehydrogenase
MIISGGLATALMLKDLEVSVDAAQSVDTDTSMGKRRLTLLAFADGGAGGQGFSSIIRSLS